MGPDGSVAIGSGHRDGVSGVLAADAAIGKSEIIAHRKAILHLSECIVIVW